MKHFKFQHFKSNYGEAMLLIGIIAGTAWIQMATDDLLSYWIIPEGVIRHGAYPGIPFNESYIQAGSSELLFRLPVLAFLYWLFSQLLGNTTTAIFLPIVIGAILLPPIVFWAFRQWNLPEWKAALITLFIYLLPPFQFFVVGAANPDPLFLVLLAALFGLYGHLLDSSETRLMLLFGIMGFFAILTRPEGIGYVVVLLVGLMYFRRRSSILAIIPALSGILVWVVISYLTAGDLWLSGYTADAYSLSHILINVKNVLSFLSHPVHRPFFLSIMLFGGALASILGLAIYFRQRVMLSTVAGLAPLVVGASANLLLLLLLTPKITEADNLGTLYQFFRHSGAIIFTLTFVSGILLDRLNLKQVLSVKLFGYGLVHLWLVGLAIPTGYASISTFQASHFGIILANPFPLLSPEYTDVGQLILNTNGYLSWRDQFSTFYGINMFTPGFIDSIGGLLKTGSIITILVVIHALLDPFDRKSN